MNRAARIARFEAIASRIKAGRTRSRGSCSAYALGCDAGNRAAFEAFALGSRAGGDWQHRAIERIKPEDEELRGWLVGYLYALQCLATNDGEWI